MTLKERTFSEKHFYIINLHKKCYDLNLSHECQLVKSYQWEINQTKIKCTYIIHMAHLEPKRKETFISISTPFFHPRTLLTNHFFCIRIAKIFIIIRFGRLDKLVGAFLNLFAKMMLFYRQSSLLKRP
jgi:hypothetical protein